ncbi:9748_t:CDS:2, partial [Scutellospora calospora]
KKKIPDSLKKFTDKTQESIVQWFNTVKANCSVSEIDDIDDYYIDPIFLGVQSISDNSVNRRRIIAGNPSDSIFSIIDAPPIENQQIIEDLIFYLRQTYYQANQTSLGRVFDIKATVK